MARIRTIKPEFWTSEKIVECSRDARLFFIGMWNFADDEGRLVNSAMQLKMKIFPAEDLLIESIQGLLTELSVNGLIKCYVVDNKEYIQIVGWDHQKINRPNPSKIPEYQEAIHGAINEPHLPEGKGREGKGREKDIPPIAPQNTKNGSVKSKYRFEGKFIKLVPDDFEKWEKAYHAIPDLNAALVGLDDWLGSQTKQKQDNWFQVISGALSKKHQDFKSNNDDWDNDKDWLV